MKSLLRTIICLVLTTAISNIGYSRTVLSESTREPIVYASVGVINRNLGTVADTLGNFSLKIPAEFINDSIRISSIGYIAKTFAVKDIKNIPDTIYLADDVMMLNEVVVKPQRIKHKTAGRKGAGGFLYIEVEGNKAAGQGLATPLNVKEWAWLKELGFTILTENRPLSKMKFRVNIYRKEDNEYILQNFNPIYFDYDKSQLNNGLFIYKFPEEIMLDEGNYYIELEFLENFSNEFFIMKSKPMTGRTRYRYASQSDWETLPFGAPIYIEYDSVE
ncbi:carboxypeptidase-like regulatory domain-containing protein [Xylanibacter rodentium]|uniref:carboxypeptidase-like regulatory domain-containing protein n=1 Tax=Xylanibacter rodentium TaxID=2736289 RepID=UPI00258EEC4F|nr:carboxypeptidase-like regulatory domain-containing protein [Xylanibacter rodentium]